MLEHWDASYFENLVREKAIRDHNQMMMESREEGRAEGREGGRAEERREIIQHMLKKMSHDQVAQMLEMPVEDIRRIANI